MKKTLILLGIILMNGVLFSCSNDEDQDLDAYEPNIELFGTGGEEEETPPPPPPPLP